jgi:hypothetical protein
VFGVRDPGRGLGLESGNFVPSFKTGDLDMIIPDSGQECDYTYDDPLPKRGGPAPGSDGGPTYAIEKTP